MNTNVYEYTANVKPPLVVTDTASISWHEEADIVTVGFGGAGVVAALQAREDGASAICIDRFAGGGATAQSGGVIYAGGTRFQSEAGFEDSAEEMFRYLSFEGTPVRDDTLRRFCETSNANVEWLIGYGVEFGSRFYGERIAYPPDEYFLYFTGMEKFRGDKAKAIPRGHRTVGKGPTGNMYFRPLKDAALNKGVRLLQHAPVRRLLVDEHHAVIGVEIQIIPEQSWAKHEALFKQVNSYKPANGTTAEKGVKACREFETSIPQQYAYIRAHAGVILSAGGYNYNLKLFGRYRPEVTAAYPVLVRGGTMGCDGSGIELGVSAGGATDYMDRVFLCKPLSPPNAFVKGVLVNMEGERFINEDAYLGNVGDLVSKQSQQGSAWLIIDSTTFWQGIKQLVYPFKNIISWWGLPALLNLFFGGTRKAQSVKLLAEKLNIDAQNLDKTVNEYNKNALQKNDPEFGKQPENIAAMNKPSYYGINMCLMNKFGFSATMPYGGLTVDEETGAVTRADGSIIQGLYAAGRSAVGICSKSNFSGLSIADTVFSGRRAARAALSQKNKQNTE